MQGKLDTKNYREMNETKTGGHLLGTANLPRLYYLNLIWSYRKTLVYVHTTLGITTVHHKARVAGASEKIKMSKCPTTKEDGLLTMYVIISS